MKPDQIAPQGGREQSDLGAILAIKVGRRHLS